MKKNLIYISIALLIGFGIYEFNNKLPADIREQALGVLNRRNWKKIANAPAPGKCDSPFLYSVGNVDSRFGLSQEVLIELSKEAEDIWDKQAGRNLLEYDPNSDFKINMVFDERQEKTDEAEVLEQKLKKLELTDIGLKKQYDAIYADYSEKVDSYNSLGKKYEKRLKEYNEDVKKWNKKGGAPPDEFEKLDDEKDALESMYKSLEKKRRELNVLSEKLNALVKKENQNISNYNTAVNTYRSKYGGSREFEKGVYNGEAINIYQFNEDSDLKLTIAHEMGHALGVGHLENPLSLMHYLLAEQDMEDPKLTEEDMEAIKNICNQ